MAAVIYTPEQLALMIASIDAQLASGVSRAGYDGKSAEFRSVNELIQIRDGYVTQLNALTGVPRRRKYLTRTRSDKGL